jgi:ABC-type transport system involved in cytochrome c biogenesis permease subunit
MILLGDRVPMFKLRPYKGLLLAAFLVLIVGGLLSAYFFIEDSYYTESRRGMFCVVITGILTLFFVIAAFSRYGFKHLRHHRPGYKRG